jgi:hypothetical protein
LETGTADLGEDMGEKEYFKKSTLFAAVVLSSLNWSLPRSFPDPWHFGPGPDPDLCLTDPDPALFVSDLQEKIKSHKEVTNIRNNVFSYYFCLMIEGSGTGSVPLTNGSGSLKLIDPDPEHCSRGIWIFELTENPNMEHDSSSWPRIATNRNPKLVNEYPSWFIGS